MGGVGPADRRPRSDAFADAVTVSPDLARDLRRRVLRPGASPAAHLPGDQLAGSVHFAVLDPDGRPLSTCFIYQDPYPDPVERPDRDRLDEPGWHLRQMATEPAARGRGAGAAVMRAVIAHVGAQGGGVLWCNARVTAIGFYQSHGLRSDGPIPPQGDPPVPHERMWRRIPPVK